jgi:hypothetical protein
MTARMPAAAPAGSGNASVLANDFGPACHAQDDDGYKKRTIKANDPKAVEGLAAMSETTPEAIAQWM